MVAPNGSIGFRLGREGQMESLAAWMAKLAKKPRYSACLGSQDDIAEVGFPYFGGDGTEHFNKVELELLPQQTAGKTPATGSWQHRLGDYRL